MYVLKYSEDGRKWFPTEYSWDSPTYLEQICSKPESKYRDIVSLFLTNNYFDVKDKKKIMQCLRHFDEVDISNDIYDALDEIKFKKYFALDNLYYGIPFVKGDIDDIEI